MAKHRQNFFSGTSNVVLPVKNKTFFPANFQDKTRLCYYASLFNTVEANSTFYKMPLARTIEKWTTEVPEDFRFTFKLIQQVTHSAKQMFNTQLIGEFMERIAPAASRQGCLLVQLPPSFTVDIFQLEHLLNELKAFNKQRWPIAVEFRHHGWYADEVFQLLGDHNIAMVLHDMPRSASPIELTSDELVYLRFHGPESGYRGSYSDEYLSEYATYINEWLDDGRTVYAYFNNTIGNAVQNLLTLNNFVLNGR